MENADARRTGWRRAGRARTLAAPVFGTLEIPRPPVVWVPVEPMQPKGDPTLLQLEYGVLRYLTTTSAGVSTAPGILYRKFYETLRLEFQSGDYFAWLGGDSFALVLAGAALMALAAEAPRGVTIRNLRYVGGETYQVIPLVWRRGLVFKGDAA